MSILADDFEGAYLWQEYRGSYGGSYPAFELSSADARSGGFSGLQPIVTTTDPRAAYDPTGGFRLFPGGTVNRGVGLGIRAEWWWIHHGSGDGTRGQAMRAGLLNPDMNGYTIRVDTATPLWRIEKRTGGQVDRIIVSDDASLSLAGLRSTWLRSVFELHADGSFDAYLYEADGETLRNYLHAEGDFLDVGQRGFGIGRIPLGTLGTFELFDRFYVGGGANWHVDDVLVDWIAA